MHIHANTKNILLFVVLVTHKLFLKLSDLLIHRVLCFSFSCCWVSTSRANGTIGCVLSQHNLFVPLLQSIHTSMQIVWTYDQPTRPLISKALAITHIHSH